jgi:type I restriction enzyme S subunit
MSVLPNKRLKHVVHLRRSRQNGRHDGRPYVGLENIESETGRLLSTNSTATNTPQQEDASLDDSQGNDFELGDVLFGKLRPYLAKAWVAEFPGRSSTEFVVMVPTGVEARFLRYICLSRGFVDAVDASTFGSKMPRADWDFIGNMPIAVPPLDQQRLITDRLDKETARLDKLIAAKERLLGLLAEKRRAVITHAVTQGVNPRVSLRDSGVSWLGRIPKHWEVWKSKRLFLLRNARAPLGSQQLTASQEYGVIPQSEFIEREGRRVVQVEKGVDILKQVEKNDFVISMRSFEGGIELSHHAGAISSAYVVLVPTGRVCVSFFTHLFKSTMYIQALRSTSSLVRDGQALRYENFTLVDLPLPPYEEQQQIATYLDGKIKGFDVLAVQTKRTIALLIERRVALISEAVAGKIDVQKAPRKVSPGEPR